MLKRHSRAGKGAAGLSRAYLCKRRRLPEIRSIFTRCLKSDKERRLTVFFLSFIIYNKIVERAEAVKDVCRVYQICKGG